MLSKGTYWALDKLEELIQENGGFVDCHRHLDRDRTLGLEDGQGHTWYERLIQLGDRGGLVTKWDLTDEMKQTPAYQNTLRSRMQRSIELMASQGVVACQSYIDVDSTIGFLALDTALKLQKEWLQQGFYLRVAASPVKGVSDSQERDIFYEGCKRADVVGGLPSRGRSGVGDEETSIRNINLLFEIAADLKKPLSMQIDQDNDPDEREIVHLIGAADQWRRKRYDQRICAVHNISMAAWWDEEEILSYIKMFRDLNIDVAVCPGAALSMTQKRWKHAPLHNSITPVPQLLAHKVTVGLGVDNVSDIYMPFTNGDIREEMREMLRAVRWQGPLEPIADIMSVSGRRILGM